MEIDLSQFRNVFYAESRERLDAMEAELLRPDVEEADAESINTIFRAAHSVKGGSATFGLDEIAGLTHHLETLLEEVRSGSRSLDKGLVDLLLQSVDCLREMIRCRESGGLADPGLGADLVSRLARHLALDAPEPAAASAAERAGRWRIAFLPHPELFQRGNDPHRILRELETLGELSVEARLSGLPPLADLDPETCRLSWTIDLRGEVSRSEIEAVFEWVENDCTLSIEAVGPAATAPRPVPTARQRAASPADARSAGNSIRVDVAKIDSLINLVGELIITESRLSRLLEARCGDDRDPLLQVRSDMSRNLRELQEAALHMRMLPIEFAFRRLPRIVRDVAEQQGKRIRLELLGGETEVDKSLLEELVDPLVHLVRNAVDHGIEDPETRRAAGKPEEALIRIEAGHESGNVAVRVTDDGRGVDPRRIRERALERGLIAVDDRLSDDAVVKLVFAAGFSTADAVSQVSGRGVGLDVVRANVQKLGGRIALDSEPGQGATFSILLPMTLSIIDGQLVRIGDSVFVLPVLRVIETVSLDPLRLQCLGGEQSLYRYRDGVVPLLDLGEHWGLREASGFPPSALVAIVQAGSRSYGLVIDALLEQQQIVVKSLEENFRRVSGLAGATILGDGAVALILDVVGLGRNAGEHRRRGRRGSPAASPQD